MKIFTELDRAYPDVKTFLEHDSIFQLVVAVILSAQCTDERVNIVTRNLFSKYNTPEDFADCSLSELEDIIRGVGLFRAKASNLKKMAAIIRDEYHNEVPNSWEDLIKLPGVGRKTANVILAVGFGLPGLGVDTHVHRVSNRLGLVRTKSPYKTELELKMIYAQKHWGKLHHLLIYHGRQVCTSRKPKCDNCILYKHCERVLEPLK